LTAGFNYAILATAKQKEEGNIGWCFLFSAWQEVLIKVYVAGLV